MEEGGLARVEAVAVAVAVLAGHGASASRRTRPTAHCDSLTNWSCHAISDKGGWNRATVHGHILQHMLLCPKRTTHTHITYCYASAPISGMHWAGHPPAEFALGN